MRNVLYYERQTLNRALFVLALLIGLLGLVALLPSSDGEQPLAPARGLIGFFMLALAVFLLNILTITTWVYEDSVRVQFGRVFPWQNTYIKLSAIDSMGTLENSEMEDVVPQGVDAASAVIMKTGASHAVHLKTDKRSYFIGTRHPERLLECIRSAREQSVLVRRG